MNNASITFSVDEDLKARFAEAAKADERSDAEILRDLLRDYVRHRQEETEHDIWFRATVEESLRQADDPDQRPIPHEEAMAKMKAVLGERIAKAGECEG